MNKKIIAEDARALGVNLVAVVAAVKLFKEDDSTYKDDALSWIGFGIACGVIYWGWRNG